MSDIDIRHHHSLPLPKARKAVEDIAKKLAAKFDMDYGWDVDDHGGWPGLGLVV